MLVKTWRPSVVIGIVACLAAFEVTRLNMSASGRSSTATLSPAPRLPRKSAVLDTLRKINSYQVAHPVVERTGSGRLITDPLEHPWPRATWYTGVMAAWHATKYRAFLEQSLAYGRQLQWQVGKEQLGPNRLFPIEVWADLYLVKRDPQMIRPAITWLASTDPFSPAGSPQWYLDRRGESQLPYADSLYGMPALAMLAKATGDRKYIDIMNDFFDKVTTALFDHDSCLYYRDTTFIGQKTPNGKKVFWSRANGWVFAGIARVLAYLPEDSPDRSRYLKIFLRMALELKKRQGTDGLWRVSLDDTEQFPNPETSGSGFFCFGLAGGINHGVLNRGEYLPAVRKAWAGLVENITPEGKILWGQGVDFEPNAVARDSTHEYVTGAVMLAGSEVYEAAPQ